MYSHGSCSRLIGEIRCWSLFGAFWSLLPVFFLTLRLAILASSTSTEVPTKLLADKNRTHLKETMFSIPGLDYSRLLKRLNEAVSITALHWGENGETLFVSSLQSSSIAIVWFLGGSLFGVFKTGQTRPACVFAHFFVIIMIDPRHSWLNGKNTKYKSFGDNSICHFFQPFLSPLFILCCWITSLTPN